MSLLNYWAGEFSIALVHIMQTWLPESFGFDPFVSGGPSAAVDHVGS
jgi:hypothetical protein